MTRSRFVGARRNASALAAPACARWAPSLPACTAVSAPPSAPAPPPVSALTSTSSTPCTSSVSFRSSVSEVIKVGRPMTPMANWATRDSCTRLRSSCAAERRSSAKTPSLMRSRSAWDREPTGGWVRWVGDGRGKGKGRGLGWAPRVSSTQGSAVRVVAPPRRRRRSRPGSSRCRG